MTQEQKAKRYDKAIAHAKIMLKIIGNAILGNLVLKNEFEIMFPELKESEDEKIRKGLIGYFLAGKCEKISSYHGISTTDILAWLEKQGNLMKALQISNAKIGELIEKNYYLKEQLEKQGKNNMGISEATKQKLEDNLNNALEKETPESCNEFLDEQGEQKPIKKHNVCEFCEDRYGCVSPCSMKLIEEEKPADKVESRQEKLTEFEKAVKQVMEEAIECGDTHNLKADADMLLRLAQNHSWSEEDKEMYGCALAMVEWYEGEYKKKVRLVSNWLKSLKDRYTWKPSDEQMDALHYVTNFDYGGHKATLVSLYEQLKKLKE